MPHKKKRFFTKSNSTKYVLYTDGRDENGEKIQQNVLVPVPRNHNPEGSLLFSHLAGVCGLPNEGIAEAMGRNEVVKPSRGEKKFSESASDKDLDLDNILDQMGESTDSEDEEYDALKSKMKQLKFFDEPYRPKNVHSNVHVEILEDGSDFSDDDFGQFSDAESDSDVESVKRGPTLTSAKLNCPENLKILNEGFEKVLEEYADDQIGGLDDEEICGTFTTENEQLQNFINTPLVKEEEHVVIGECDESLKRKILWFTEVEEPDHYIRLKTEKPLEYDCESIISTYSNKYNHPVIIKEESKIRKIKIPENPLKSRLTRSQLKTLDESESESEEEDDDDVSVTTSCNIRVKGETPEQKRERKALFKEAKRESRKLKKENKLAFKHQKKLQSAIEINRRNNKGMKLV